jgi:superfamily II DNA or RNA helicase
MFNEKQYIPQELRPYQREAVDAVKQSWERGFQSSLVAMATGGGKTTVISQLLAEEFDPGKHRALILAHTEEIISQLYQRVENQFAGKLGGYFISGRGSLAPGLGVVMNTRNDSNARMLIATRQSLHAKRLKAVLEHDPIDFLVIDECHHSFAANSYGDIISAIRKQNPAVRILGTTATPKRTDRKALGTLWDHIAYEWLIDEGINSGYLVPLIRLSVSTRVDASQIKTSHGDYNQKGLISVLETSNWLSLCMAAYERYAVPYNRPTLAFMPSVEMSKDFVAELVKRGIAARHLDGETPRETRRAMLRDYAESRIHLISNFGVVTEGYDSPATGIIFLARPTRSEILFSQIIGRGLRPYPGKENCVLIDMTVLDTKPLKRGSLMGRMVKCPKCGTEYHYGFSSCPTCGFVPDKTKSTRERDNGGDEIVAGAGLYAEFDNVFRNAYAAWYKSGAYLSCGVGENGALVIVPPDRDDFYRLVFVPRDRDKPLEMLNRNTDVASLIIDADKDVKRRANVLADKDARWRMSTISDNQRDLVRSLRGDPDGMTKGQAAQFITHVFSVRRIRKEMTSQH